MQLAVFRRTAAFTVKIIEHRRWKIDRTSFNDDVYEVFERNFRRNEKEAH